jgi:hypothetical protein
MGTLQPYPPPPPPVATFDGSFRTTIHLVSSFGSAMETSWCTSPGQPVITITDGQFNYSVPHPNVPGNATPVYPANMAEDGSFYGQIVAGTISGSVDGSRIQGKIDGSACIYTFSGYRV